jgi:hypothetical protein
MERLAGALCNINQQDKHSVLSVDHKKQADLDAVCSEFNLPSWRKARDRRGNLLPGARSWITDSYDRFKAQYANPTPAFTRYVNKHFPGYPEKHSRMESLDVQASGRAPPRGKLRSQARLRKVQAEKGLRSVEEVTKHVTVCRVCRQEVEPHHWQQHVASAAHRRALMRNKKSLRRQ